MHDNVAANHLGQRVFVFELENAMLDGRKVLVFQTD